MIFTFCKLFILFITQIKFQICILTFEVPLHVTYLPGLIDVNCWSTSRIQVYKGASFQLRLEIEICTANLKDNMEDKNFNITWINQESNSYSDLPDPALAHLMTFIGLTLLTVGFVVHKAVYQLLNRFSNRYINQIIYPYTVRLSKWCLFRKMNCHFALLTDMHNDFLAVFLHHTNCKKLLASYERLYRRPILLCVLLRDLIWIGGISIPIIFHQFVPICLHQS